MVAMKGKGCVAIASDKRLGAQALTVGMNFPKAFPVADKVYLGMAGLASDIQTLYVLVGTLFCRSCFFSISLVWPRCSFRPICIGWRNIAR